MGGHEVDRIGRRHLRRNDQIALVLAVLVIDENAHAAIAGILDDLLDAGDRVGPVPLYRTRSFILHLGRTFLIRNRF